MKTQEEKKICSEIQKKLFAIIPEKWDSIYLYASVIDIPNKHVTGEMYFYYFPKSIMNIKKKPVNCYEVPSQFNIDEAEYSDLISGIYTLVKKLREIYINKYNKRWSNITISIKDFKFKVEYDYENLNKSNFDSYERHIIWRYLYLKEDTKMFGRKEKSIIKNYLLEIENKKPPKIDVYVDKMFDKPVKNIVDFEKTLSVEEALARTEKDERIKVEKIKKEKHKIFNKNKKLQDIIEMNDEDENEDINNQILNWKNK